MREQESRWRVARAVLCSLVASLATSACAEKTLVPTAVRSPLFSLQLRTNFAEQNAPSARTISIRVGYDRLTGSRVGIGASTVAASAGGQSIAIPINLTECIADEDRAGARDVCPLRISIALRDSSAIALDSVEIGPVDGGAGVTPNVPPIDLATQRFAAREWVFDESLQLGGNPPLNPTGLRGVVTGSGPPTLYQFGAGGGALGGAIVALENGRWQTTGFGLQNTSFQDFTMVTPTEGWFGASSGSPRGLFRYNGTNLTPITQVGDSVLAVSVLAAGTSRLIMAAGQSSKLWRGDGTNWTMDQLNGAFPLTQVCVTAIDEAFVVSSNAQSGIVVWRWNGTQWNTTPLPFPGGLSQLSCAGRGQAYVRSRSQADTSIFSFHSWNGNTWDEIPLTGIAASVKLRDFAVVSPSEIYGWGIDPNWVRHWYRFNGSTWTQIAQSAYGQGATGIWADPRGNRAYMVFNSGRLEGFDAASGQRTTMSYIPAAKDGMMSSPTNAVVVGGNEFLARWNGTRWTVDAPPANTPTIRNLHGVWTDGPSNAWAVGNKSTIFRWDGVRWNIVSDTLTQIAGLDDYNAVWGRGSAVFVAGNNILRCTGPNACANDAVPGSGALFGIWGIGASDVFAVGDGGRIVHSDGTGWTQMSSPTARKLTRVWGSSASDVWAVGDSALVHFNGTSWTNVPMTGALTTLQLRIGPTANPFQIGLWGSAANDVYLSGPLGRIARYNGTTWTLIPSPVSVSRVVAITGVAGFGALAIVGNGELFRGAGPNGGLSAVSGAPVIWP